MPTIITHALLPLIGAAVIRPAIPARLVVAGMIVALAPDIDVIGRAFGVPHYALLGHRGISHSLLAAALLAMLAYVTVPGSRGWRSFLFLLAAAASHGLADMATHGSKGIMLLWPVSSIRLAWPVQPVEASGVLMRSITDGSLPSILVAELLWLILPAILLAALYRLGRRPYIDSGKGQS